MLRLQMLPAGVGDCLWLEYGTPPATRVVIIDGGLGKTAKVLRARIEAACRERGSTRLEVELLVVTHIDNDHIVGIIELLKDPPPFLHVKEVWFNGLPQLKLLPTPDSLEDDEPDDKKPKRTLPPDVLGGDDEDEDSDEDDPFSATSSLKSPADVLGRPQSDQLSQLLASSGMPWNASWDGKAVMIPKTGDLPTKTLGELKLTILGPTLPRLYKLCTAWSDVLGGEEDSSKDALPADVLGPSDTWPPVWKEGEKRDSSFANGSSIMLLAEYGKHALLLAGDGHAPDIAKVMKRLLEERKLSSTSFPVSAFKLPHHGSAHNLTQEVLERVDCRPYLISTDGTGRPRHPDHQALLRILRYSRQRPHLFFNYLGDTTRPWGESKADVVDGEFQDFDITFPTKAEDGLIMDFE